MIITRLLTNVSPPIRRADGQALLEFALVIPIVMALLFTLVDFGRVIFVQNAVTQAAREGVRAGVVQVGNLTDDTQYVAQYTRIRNAALALSPSADFTAADIVGDAPACAEPAAADPVSGDTCFYPDGPTAGGRVVVNVSTTVEPITPIISLLGILTGAGHDIGPITVSARSVGVIQPTTVAPTP